MPTVIAAGAVYNTNRKTQVVRIEKVIENGAVR